MSQIFVYIFIYIFSAASNGTTGDQDTSPEAVILVNLGKEEICSLKNIGLGDPIKVKIFSKTRQILFLPFWLTQLSQNIFPISAVIFEGCCLGTLS